jgi:lipopolysaccharide transport system ATP-binding protein
MQDIGQKGRTVLFVSHNMLAITQLCKRTILFDKGRVIQEGPSHQVVRNYLSAGMTAMGEQSWPDPAAAPGGEWARVLAVRVRKEDGQVTNSFDIRQPVVVEMEYSVLKEGRQFLPHFRFINEEDIALFESLDNDPAWRRRPRPKGHYINSVTIPGNFLAEGKLFVSCHLLGLYPTDIQFSLRKIISFEVMDCGEGDSARGDWMGNMDGVVRPLWDWKTQYDLNGSK